MSDYRSIPPDAPEEPFVVVHRPIDGIEGEVMTQILRDHGIECRLLGTRHAASIGVGQQITPLRLEVVASKLEEARELLAAMRPETTDDEELPRPRKAILALGCTMLFFGGSHMYARRPWTAGVIAITQLSAILLNKTVWPNAPVSVGAMVTLLALDAIFGVRAARAHNRGDRPGPLPQALAGMCWAICAALVGSLYALVGAR